MTREELKEKLINLFSEKFSVRKEKITEESNFEKDLNCDSLDIMDTLVFSVEEMFDININEYDEKFEEIDTVGKYIDYIYEMVK